MTQTCCSILRWSCSTQVGLSLSLCVCVCVPSVAVACTRAHTDSLSLSSGYPQDALVIIDRAVKLAPRGMLYRYIRATIYDALGNREREALAEYEAVVRITPLFEPALERIKQGKIAALPSPLAGLLQQLPWLGDLCLLF